MYAAIRLIDVLSSGGTSVSAAASRHRARDEAAVLVVDVLYGVLVAIALSIVDLDPAGGSTPRCDPGIRARRGRDA